MATLTPVAGYDPIPQLEKTDRVVGGAGGTSNEQAQALINNIEQVKQDYVNANRIGNPNGVASLDENGKVPQSQIPTTGSLKGSWDANANSPAITQGSPIVGGVTVGNSDYFMVSVGGTWDGTTFDIGDRLVWSEDNSNWFRLAGSSVTSVNGMQGAVSVPKTTIVLGSQSFISNYDEKLVVNSSNCILQLGDGTNYFQKREILFLTNAYVKYRNINGIITDSSSSAPPNDFILSGRQVTYVWNGTGWFANEGIPLGKIIMQMPDEDLPSRLYGGGWERRRYGHTFLRDSGGWGLFAYNVTFTTVTTCTGSFPADIYSNCEPWFVAYGSNISAISQMGAGNVTLASGIFPSSGTGTIIFGLKETLTLGKTYWDGSFRIRGTDKHNAPNARINSASGVFSTSNAEVRTCGDYSSAYNAPAQINFGLNLATGNGIISRTNVDGFACKPHSIGVAFWKRIY